MNDQLRYETWVYWNKLTKEEQDDIIEIRCEQYRYMQEFNKEENQDED